MRAPSLQPTTIDNLRYIAGLIPELRVQPGLDEDTLTRKVVAGTLHLVKEVAREAVTAWELRQELIDATGEEVGTPAPVPPTVPSPADILEGNELYPRLAKLLEAVAPNCFLGTPVNSAEALTDLRIVVQSMRHELESVRREQVYLKRMIDESTEG